MTNLKSSDYIKYIADLSKLALPEEELQALAKDMQDIIGLMDEIKNIDTDNINAKEHISSITNKMREDIPANVSNTNKLLSNSKLTIDNCFAIPKIIE